MGKLQVHVSVSSTHADLVARHLAPSLEATAGGEACLVLHQVSQECESGRFRSEGWPEQIREKFAVIRQAAAAVDEGEPFAMCDADVVFLGPWVAPALERLDGHELVHMGEPGFSPAFWLARSTPRLREMLDDLWARWGSWTGDGKALIEGIDVHGIDAAALDTRFANPGNLGHPLPLLFGRATFTPPPDTLLFHANFCALDDKDALLSEVQRLADGGERVRNDDLSAAGPEGLGFFPARRPDRPFDRQSMFARPKARDVLAAVGDRPVSLIVEVGSWLGASTRWFLETFSGARQLGGEHEYARIICIDPWTGFRESSRSELAARALASWEQFATNCWHLRQWITPVRLPSQDGIPAIAAELARQGEPPDVVFIDGDHGYEMCRHDVLASVRAWPDALVIGDDAWIEGEDGERERPVHDAVRDAAEELGRTVEMYSSGIWALGGNDADAE